MGPRQDKSIPIEILTPDGITNAEERNVLEIWREDFKKPFNGGNSDKFNNDHYEHPTIHKTLLEQNMSDPLYESNDEINSDISQMR